MAASPPADSSAHGPRVYRFADFRFDAATSLLHRDDRDVPVPARALAVLRCLLEHAGEPVAKDTLLTEAWPGSFVSEDSLTHAVSLLRQALGDDSREPRFIQTLSRRGYRFVAAVEIDAPLPTGMATPSAVHKATQAGRRLSPVIVMVVAGLLVIVAAALGYAWLTRIAGGDTSVTAPEDPDVLRISRLGASDLAAVGGPAAQEFARAVMPAVVDAIERKTLLAVQTMGPGTMAAARGVDAVLAGEVVAEDGRLRVVLRVRSSGTDESWWRQEWDLPESWIEPEAFAASVMTRLRFLLDHTSAHSTLRPATSAEALRLGVRAANQLLGAAQQDLQVALEAANALRRATELDPHFARARAGRVAILAEAAGWRELTSEELEQAAADSARALEDDPDDPVVHIAIALHALLVEDVETARLALDRALGLAPDMFWIYMIRSDLEMRQEVPSVALATTLRGLEFDPYLPSMHGRLVDVHLATGDLDAAQSAVERLVALDPRGYWSGRARAQLARAAGDLDRAEELLLELRERWATAPWVHQMLMGVWSESGQTDRAEKAHRALEALSRER